MDTEPYISTVDDLDKFLEEMDTEVSEPVTPIKSNKVISSKKVIRFVIYKHISTYKICMVTLEILSI